MQLHSPCSRSAWNGQIGPTLQKGPGCLPWWGCAPLEAASCARSQSTGSWKWNRSQRPRSQAGSRSCGPSSSASSVHSTLNAKFYLPERLLSQSLLMPVILTNTLFGTGSLPKQVQLLSNIPQMYSALCKQFASDESCTLHLLQVIDNLSQKVATPVSMSRSFNRLSTILVHLSLGKIGRIAPSWLPENCLSFEEQLQVLQALPPAQRTGAWRRLWFWPRQHGTAHSAPASCECLERGRCSDRKLPLSVSPCWREDSCPRSRCAQRSTASLQQSTRAWDTKQQASEEQVQSWNSLLLGSLYMLKRHESTQNQAVCPYVSILHVL